jgi:quinol-cytochrome oxidoreductase complex cytochrome b subunit
MPRTAAQRKRFPLKNLVLHFRPATVPQKTMRLSLTWGLGGMAATLVLLQLGTGVLLKFAYEPTPVAAYASVQAIIAGMPFGRLIRNLHHWCAHLLVVTAILHMLRVFFTGAFHPPRQFNWIIGWTLVCTLLIANFTGYLLPWDQLAFWAVTVSTGMLEYIPFIGVHLQEIFREGTEIGPATLQAFFALHTAVVPVFLLGLMAFHFWRIRKSKGLVIPRMPGEPPDENPARVPIVPDLLLRETVAALVLVAAVLLLATFFNAPLAAEANPGLSPNPTLAPWYFAGLQELLLHLHPVFAVCVIPALAGFGLLAIPYLKYDVDTGGIWFASRAGRKTGGIAALAGMLLTPLLILADEWLSKEGSQFAGISPIIGNGVIPTVVLVTAIGFFYLILKRRFRATRNEAVQAVFILLLAAYGVLTLTGIWFRGAGMVLTVPW